MDKFSHSNSFSDFDEKHIDKKMLVTTRKRM